jgi:O-antigen ligase
MLVAFSGLGAVIGTVAVNVANCIYMTYLLSIYLARQGKQRDIRSTAVRNRFGAASTIAVFFLAWAGLSLLWTPSLASATLYYFAYLVQVIVAYLLCKLYLIRDVFCSACKGSAYGAVAAIPLAILLTRFSSGRLGEVSGAVTIVSTLAFSACTGILSVAYLGGIRAISKSMATFLMIILLAGMYLTFAKTEIIGLAMAGGVYVLVAPGSVGRRLARIAWMAAGTTVAWFSAASKVAEYTNKGQTDTLSGRTLLWAQTYLQISNGPWIRGFGFLAFREIGPNPFSSVGSLAVAHNEFLNVWFNFGMVGVALVFASYLALSLSSFRARRRGGGLITVLTLCAVVFCLVRGVGEASVTMCVLPIPWILLLDCMVSTCISGSVRSVVPQRSHIGVA